MTRGKCVHTKRFDCIKECSEARNCTIFSMVFALKERIRESIYSYSKDLIKENTEAMFKEWKEKKKKCMKEHKSK